MTESDLLLCGRHVRVIGDPDAEEVILCPIGAHDDTLFSAEIAEIAKTDGNSSRLFVFITAENWNRDLSPWEAAPFAGKECFGGGASETLSFLLSSLLPFLSVRFPDAGKRTLLAGYSLAGLFALWAATETDRFDGIAAVSPSVWYPEWISYAEAHAFRTRAVCLSLGDREEKTRNPVLASVGTAIRAQHRILREKGIPSVLEWNEGNHFAFPAQRTARGILRLSNMISTLPVHIDSEGEH